MIPTAMQATQHQDVATVEEASLIEGETEAHPRNPQKLEPKSPNEPDRNNS